MLYVQCLVYSVVLGGSDVFMFGGSGVKGGIPVVFGVEFGVPRAV